MKKIQRALLVIVGISIAAMAAASCSGTWNDPYPASESGEIILYSSFSERPKHLDPARSYSSNEYVFIGQIYEPPLQYHFLKRPYELEPLTAAAVPRPVFLDADNRHVDDENSVDIAYSVYEIHIKQGIYYQPHPAFAQDSTGRYVYHNLTPDDLSDVHTLADLPLAGMTATRELVASDYVNQIKRIAHPGLYSPIFSLMSEYIVGLKEYGRKLKQDYDEQVKEGVSNGYLDLDAHPLEGVEVVDRYTYRIKVLGKYPQLLYWLAMPFFSAMPPEADLFYSQPGLRERNITLDWYPVGTGAYMLTVNNPNRRMVLERNPNFHKDYYPSVGEPDDAETGLLKDARKQLPLIDKVVYSLEKENIPYWNKFLQGYYDVSGISSDSFDQAIQFGAGGDPELTPAMRQKNIGLVTRVQASSFYMGFNMLDSAVGGYSERARKLRRAISMAVDYEDFISIFRNGRGIAAQGPLPPGIFGYVEGEAGINPYVYVWENDRPRRRAIDEAKRLLAEAGYPDGRDAETGDPLLIHLDITAGGPEDKAFLDWFRKQFRKIDLELVIRNTDYNRFQDKMREGNAQVFMWGWNADYPDPENFLFLLYGPNGKVKHGGENAANYDNPEFNILFEKLKNMQNGPKRMSLIREAVEIARRDAPWLWGFHPKEFVLHHAWYHNAKPNQMAHNSLKYRRINAQMRSRLRHEWNSPDFWPPIILAVALMLWVVPAVVLYMRRQRQPARTSGLREE